ncbi:tail fiber protein [Enterococcus phage 9181]|nr:tail fiber protein [Enterococcus phage 9181]
MPCVYKPNYVPYDFMNLSPAYQWGIGRVAGYTHFDQAEFQTIEGESHVTWDINFKNKIARDLTSNPHRLIAENKNHVFHNNILRGSRFLSNPVLLFNGAKYVETAQDNNSAVAMSEQTDQGLMFYWDDFIGDYGVMKKGDTVTISVDIRTNNKDVDLVEAVRLKATPNFEPYSKITTQEVNDGFTRIVFQTKVLNTEWLPEDGWETIWGVQNPETSSKYTGREWNKDRLIGIVQNIPNVQLEYTRPMVSLEGSTTYQEAAMDQITKNVFSWNGMQKKHILQDNGLFATSKYDYEYANPNFLSVPQGSQWQGVASLVFMKFTKKAYQVKPEDETLNVYGKLVWYSDKTETSKIATNVFTKEDGKYGGELSILPIPEGAKYYRLHVTAHSQQSVEFRMGFTDISYVNNSSQSAELTQAMYDGVAEMLDGKVARVYADNYIERVKIDYKIDLLAEMRRAFPKIFEGLSIEESVERIRTIAYLMDLTATARGGDDDNIIHWHMKSREGIAGEIHGFGKEELTTYTHRSTWQDWIQDDGTLWGYFYTDSPRPNNGTQAWIELDYFNIRMTIVAKNTEIDAWGFRSDDSRYDKTSVDIPMMRTEENMQNSSVQVTHGYDIYGIVNAKYPEFFGDCYTYEDCINKLNERIESFTFEVSSTIPDPDVGGAGYVNFVVEATEHIRDTTTKLDKNTSDFIIVHNGLNKFVQENGYVYLGGERPPEDRNTELGITSNVTFQLKFDKNYDNNKRIFRYNKKKQPWFLFVRDIQRSVLPPKVNNLVDMNRGRNRYSYGQTEEARSITLQCFIKAPSEQDLAPLLEELADYLDVGETTLQLYDNPERVYKVVLDGSTDISQTLHMGELSLNFILLDNYAVGKEVVVRESFGSSTSVPFLQLQNEGTAPTYPTYLLDFKEDAQFVDLIGQNESANISVGRRSKASSGSTNKNMRPQVFYSKFTDNDGSGWIALNDTLISQKIEGKKPTLQGSVQRSNGMINMNRWDYGDAKDGWHGHGVIGTLKKNVNNFVCEASATILGKPLKESLNGFFLIFYDAVNKPIARVKLSTRTADGHLDSYIVDDEEADSWGNHNLVISQGATTKWDNFQGKVIVERKNNQWRLTVGQMKDRRWSPAPESSFNMGTAMLKDVKTTGWRTLDSATWDREVARVGIFLAQRQQRPKIGHVSLRRLIVWEDLTEDATTPDEDPIMINAGDQVAIDSEKGQVYLNGVVTPKLVDPMTDWFSIEKGENLVGVNNFIGDLTVVYNERFK